MNYENYIELYEAVYFFNRINCCMDNKIPQLLNKEEISQLGLNESIYRAVLRILVVNDLLDYDEKIFLLTEENIDNQQDILDNIINKDPNKQYTTLFSKATNEGQFFFDSICDFEYEIYSRCNFQVTFKTGKEVAKHVNLANKKLLELGGNSGGFGTALLANNINCQYTVVDRKIPCQVGNEFNELNETHIAFIEGNVFELNLSNQIYDYVIIMNLLHDFDDEKCLNIMKNCTKYCDKETKFLIIEDVLTSEIEPKEAIMHGLRLSVECRGGKQRTIDEFAQLFSDINYKLDETTIISSVHTMLVMDSKID